MPGTKHLFTYELLLCSKCLTSGTIWESFGNMIACSLSSQELNQQKLEKQCFLSFWPLGSMMMFHDYPQSLPAVLLLLHKMGVGILPPRNAGMAVVCFISWETNSGVARNKYFDV